MSADRIAAMVGLLVWRQSDGTYLILERSERKGFAAGQWECVTAPVGHGEGYSVAAHRAATQLLGRAVQLEFLIGTAHLYRGVVRPENELLGVHFGCTLAEAQDIRLSPEHSARKWVTVEQAESLFPPGHSLRNLIVRAELMRARLPEEIKQFHRTNGFEI